MNFLFQGLTMGLAYLAPIGLQNLFVINSALNQQRRRAMATALITTCFDIALSLSCFFGIGAVLQRYQWLEGIVLFGGSLIVIYIGTSLLRATEQTATATTTVDTIQQTIITVFVVTWCNPQALIDGTMMLGAFHVTLPTASATPFISGVALASLLWFSGLALLIGTFKHLFNARTFLWINRICGLVIVAYGCKLFYNFIQLLH